MVSAILVGLPILSLAVVLLAETTKSVPNAKAAPVDYLPGVAVLAAWIYYVQRPKTPGAMVWNGAYLVGLTLGVVLVAYVLDPDVIVVALMYWSLAVLTTGGVPVLIAIVLLGAHQWICVVAAAAVDPATGASTRK